MRSNTVPDRLILTRTGSAARSPASPSRDEIAPIVNEQLIVGLYSRQSSDESFFSLAPILVNERIHIFVT